MDVGRRIDRGRGRFGGGGEGRVLGRLADELPFGGVRPNRAPASARERQAGVGDGAIGREPHDARHADHGEVAVAPTDLEI